MTATEHRERDAHLFRYGITHMRETIAKTMNGYLPVNVAALVAGYATIDPCAITTIATPDFKIVVNLALDQGDETVQWKCTAAFDKDWTVGFTFRLETSKSIVECVPAWHQFHGACWVLCNEDKHGRRELVAYLEKAYRKVRKDLELVEMASCLSGAVDKIVAALSEKLAAATVCRCGASAV